jgi:hypothetical protein
MVIGNTETNSLAGTTYAQPTAASQSSAKTSSLLGSDSVHLSATAEANGFRQQGLSISQIASLMGVTSAEVDTYLHITPVAAVGAVGYGGGGAVESTTTPKSTSSTSTADTSKVNSASTTAPGTTATNKTAASDKAAAAGTTPSKTTPISSGVINSATATVASTLRAA